MAQVTENLFNRGPKICKKKFKKSSGIIRLFADIQVSAQSSLPSCEIGHTNKCQHKFACVQYVKKKNIFLAETKGKINISFSWRNIAIFFLGKGKM